MLLAGLLTPRPPRFNTGVYTMVVRTSLLKSGAMWLSMNSYLSGLAWLANMCPISTSERSLLSRYSQNSA